MDFEVRYKYVDGDYKCRLFAFQSYAEEFVLSVQRRVGWASLRRKSTGEIIAVTELED